MFQNHLVSIGAQHNYTEIYPFIGTGILISIKDSQYIVTCKHVLKSPNTCIEKNNDTDLDDDVYYAFSPKNLNMGQVFAILGEPKFHPDDNELETFDICIMKIIGNPFTQDCKSPLDILNNRMISEIPHIGKVIAEGFPAKYTNNGLRKNNDEHLKPDNIQGFFMNKFFHDIKYKTGKQLKEAYFAQMPDMYQNRYNGMSGGIVYEIKSQLIIGILLGSYEYPYSHPSLGKCTSRGFIFASIKRVIELINNRHTTN